jgi:carbonic anhydrase
MAHTNCLAVQAVLEEKSNAPGGMLRYQIYPSVQEARQAKSGDVLNDAIKRNALHAAERLVAESYIVRQAVEAKTLSIVSAIYNLENGGIEVLGA